MLPCELLAAPFPVLVAVRCGERCAGVGRVSATCGTPSELNGGVCARGMASLEGRCVPLGDGSLRIDCGTPVAEHACNGVHRRRRSGDAELDALLWPAEPCRDRGGAGVTVHRHVGGRDTPPTRRRDIEYLLGGRSPLPHLALLTGGSSTEGGAGA